MLRRTHRVRLEAWPKLNITGGCCYSQIIGRKRISLIGPTES